MLAGAVVAAAGAMIWAIVSLSMSFTFQVLAIAIGAACGFAIGHFGRAVDHRFARMAAYSCILSCVGGELLVVYALQVGSRVPLPRTCVRSSGYRAIRNERSGTSGTKSSDGRNDGR